MKIALSTVAIAVSLVTAAAALAGPKAVQMLPKLLAKAKSWRERARVFVGAHLTATAMVLIGCLVLGPIIAVAAYALSCFDEEGPSASLPAAPCGAASGSPCGAPASSASDAPVGTPAPADPDDAPAPNGDEGVCPTIALYAPEYKRCPFYAYVDTAETCEIPKDAIVLPTGDLGQDIRGYCARLELAHRADPTAR